MTDAKKTGKTDEDKDEAGNRKEREETQSSPNKSAEDQQRVCQKVKVIVIDNLHDCSACEAEECSAIAVNMFKKASTPIKDQVILLFQQTLSLSKLTFQYLWNTAPGLLGHLQTPGITSLCDGYLTHIEIVCKKEEGMFDKSNYHFLRF